MGVRHPEYVLAGAVAVSLPMVPDLFRGQISDTAAATRFLVALVACWMMGSLLSWVITTYSQQARKAQLLKMFAEPEEGKDAGND